MKLLVMAMVMMIAVFTGCSEIGPVNGQNTNAAWSPAVAKGSLLVIDEKNRVLKVLNPATGAVSNVFNVSNAGNDIQISGNYAYLLSSTDGKLFRLDLSNGGASATHSFPAGANPYNLAIGGGRVYVSLSVSNQLCVLDQEALTVVTNVALPAGGYPEGVALEGGYVYLTSFDLYVYSVNRLYALRTNDFSLAGTVTVQSNPQSVTADAAGRIWTACSGAYITTNSANWSGYYSGGGLSLSTAPSGSSSDSFVGSQFFFAAADAGSLYVLDSAYGSSASGLNVIGTNGARVTNLMAGKDLKNVVFDALYLWVPEYWDKTVTWKIRKSDWSIAGVYSNIGGGVCALY